MDSYVNLKVNKKNCFETPISIKIRNITVVNYHEHTTTQELEGFSTGKVLINKNTKMEYKQLQIVKSASHRLGLQNTMP